jgi:hypothetical protein
VRTREKGKGRREKGVLFPFPFSLFPFVLLATLNSAGYRFGASDQAFYIPAVLARLDPELFPRDRELIASQARLTRIDETMATLVRMTGLDLPPLYFALYLVSLALLAAAGWWIARHLYRSAWTSAALLAALTMRHAIAKSGTNTLESYFHPRQLAFGLGALAIGGFLHGRPAIAVALVAAAGFFHPTTAMWFALWLTVAAAVEHRRLRLAAGAAAVAGAVLAAWALTAGPLAGRLIVMDPAWLATLETKDYLFPLDWPAAAWIFNLAYIPIIVGVYRWRAVVGATAPREFAAVVGCLSLLLVFGCALPLTALPLAFAVQLQTPRVFWMLDFLAIVYAVWAIAEGARPGPRRARMAAAAIVCLSLARGAYVMITRFPDRALAQVAIPDDDWGRVMAWARSTPKDSGWMADPVHAVRYGSSVRVAGQRDVLVEAVKDAAIGMYDRSVAMRTAERLAALSAFEQLDDDHARALGERYGLDYLVTEQPLTLPEAYRSGALRVYRLRAAPATAAASSPPR